jgi:hypothetical protein
MKTREICRLFLSKSDKSFVRNCIYENMIKFEAIFQLKCMNIEREINLSSTSFQMETDLVAIFDSVTDKNLCPEFMCNQSKKKNATLIFLIAFKVEKMAYEKLSGDSYNWFIKSLTEKMVSILETMTMYSEKEWNLYLLGKPDETRQNMRDMVLYSIVLLFGMQTIKNIIA